MTKWDACTCSHTKPTSESICQKGGQKVRHWTILPPILAKATLPAKFGFSDAAAFIRAFRGATGGGTAGKGKRHKRTVITDEIKGKVKAMIVAGKTGAEISSTVGISLPSVQNIRKELGLTKSRKK